MNKFKLKSPQEYRKDKNYINVAYGGKNRCIVRDFSDGCVLPNCVGYAWGRFMEILGETPELSCGDAGTWYIWQYDNYKRGQKPQVGAAICWSREGDAGHVAIVEEINPDGSLKLSESGWSYPLYGQLVYEQTVYPPNYQCDWMKHYDPPYIFQGFIYNPKSPLDTAYTDFVDIATISLGVKADTILKEFGLKKSTKWNSIFPYYCARKAGVTKIMPLKFSATDFITTVVKDYGGTFHEKALLLGAKRYVPKPGDIICLVTSNKKQSNKYYADRIGIVYNSSVNNTKMTVYAMVGDSNGKVEEITYDAQSNFISGFLEFDWTRVKSSSAGSVYLRGEIYDEQNDENDALLREIAYAGKNQPLINMTDTKLSIINYTSALAAFFRQVGILTEIENPDLDRPTGEFRFEDSAKYPGSKIFDEFIRQGVTAAGAVGIMSYMYFESGGWNPAAINLWENQPWEYRGRGLCQWSLGRAVAFVAAVPDWETNVTAQVRYCVNEMKSSYKQLYDYVMSVPNTKEGATKAATKVSLVFGAGLPFNWDDTHTFAQYPYGGEWGLSVHVDPAAEIWENNITTVSLPNANEPINMNEVRKGKII